MAIQCPRCGHQFEQDFGLVTCSQCQAVSVIDFDGTARLADQENGHQQSETKLEPPSENFEEIQSVDEIMNQLGQVDAQAPPPPPPPTQAAQTLDEIPNFDQLGPPPSQIEESKESTKSLDLTEFANKDLNDSGLSYTLTVEGIDHLSMRENLKAIISDPRLGLSVPDLLRSIKGGSLKLEELDPARASILVRSLRNLGLAVKWDQHVL